MKPYPQIGRVQNRLDRYYGRPGAKRYPSLVDALVETILSQNTSDINSRRAFLNLKERYPGWDNVLNSPLSLLENVIRVGGLSRVKSARIRRLLSRIKRERGTISLEHLKKMDSEQAYQTLLSYEGVGPKTAACTLLFGAGMPVFPVDTHVFRVCSRLGWVGGKETAEKFQERFRHLIPGKYVYSLHMNLVTHGRLVCHPRNPDCHLCVIHAQCRYYLKTKIAEGRYAESEKRMDITVSAAADFGRVLTKTQR
jgi:endonuclease-3